jgi:DNA-binding beta-propeller fold protein YncE
LQAQQSLMLLNWGSRGSGDTQFKSPSGVAVDGNGNVYVADTNNYRIVKYSSSGVYITQWGSLGSGDTQFKDPYDVGVDGSGNVYVADTSNNRIVKYYDSDFDLDLIVTPEAPYGLLVFAAVGVALVAFRVTKIHTKTYPVLA